MPFFSVPSSPRPQLKQIRQLALVELRKRVTVKKNKQWLGQTPAVRTAIKAGLLELLANETTWVPLPRSSLSLARSFSLPNPILSNHRSQARAAATRFVSALARIEMPEATWPELLPWLWGLTSSPTATLRELALQTIYVLVETIIMTPASKGAGIDGHVLFLLDIFRRLLGDESLAVRIWVVRALGKASEYIETGEDAEIVSCLLDTLLSRAETDSGCR